MKLMFQRASGGVW